MSTFTKPTRIDVHHHILPPKYIATLGDRLGPQGLLGPPPQWNPLASIEEMDRNGIATAVTSISAPGFRFGDNAGMMRGLVRLCNEYAATMARDYPGRFGMFASLPLPDIDASLSEIAYSFDTLSADGVSLMTHYGGKYPGDPLFQPVLQELNRRKAVVFFHPTWPAYGKCLEEIPMPTLEFPFETTRAIVSLLASGALARFRDIRFLFSHAGGTLPFLVERIARLTVRPDFRKAVPDGVIPELQRLHFDVALSANRFVFGPLLQLAASTNILFGSDYPHAGGPTMAATVRGLTELGLDKESLEAIEYGNAHRLFPRFSGT